METRVQKYSKYRGELIKEGAVKLDDSATPLDNTRTLPLNEVMNSEEEKNANLYYKKRRKLQILQMALLASIAILVVAGIIVAGVLVFTKG